MIDLKKEILSFLQSKQLLILASSQDNVPWVCNVYLAVDEECNLYFVSGKNRAHSKHILENPQVAFSIPWYNEKDLGDRKAIQGVGVCRALDSDDEIKKGLSYYNKAYPLSKDEITFDFIKDPKTSDLWIIEPTFMKFWNDELFGPEGTEETTFEK